jgi:hypothetical protein
MTLDLTWTDDGEGVVTFTITQNPADASSATLDPGDGHGITYTVPLTSGTGTQAHTYTDAGPQTYTATATAARTPSMTDLQAVADAYATLDAIPADYATLYDLYAPSIDTETATAEVTVTVPGAALHATVETSPAPPWVLLSAWLSEPETVTSWTITRIGGADRLVIAAGTTIESGTVDEDHEAPFGTPIFYRLHLVRSDGTTEDHDSETVTLPAPDACWVSDPVTGLAMAIEIQAWDAREWDERQAVLAVVGRADPVVISDVNLWPNGTITFLTRTRARLAELMAILRASNIIQLRPDTGCAIQAMYAAVGKITENRVSSQCEDWRRTIDVEIQEVSPVPYTLKPSSATLGDLSDAFPGTLADLNVRFGTLLQMAEWRPES